MSDLRKLLDQHLPKGVMAGAQWVQQRTELARQREAGDFEVDKVAGGQVVGDAEGSFFLIKREFPLDYMQGNIHLGAALDSSAAHVAFSSCDDLLKDFNPRTTFFMDTETIGLMGGAGTVAFLIGVGYFTETAFCLEQCFMRDYDDEEPMLQYLGELCKRCETVVSYNGKSFDMPLLRARFIQNRVPFHMDSALHYDLVHATRRFWKRRLSDCSLKNIEAEILGIRRHGDVPSMLIGQFWFDYLRTRDARPLKGVFYHHQMDILSLVTLTAWLCKCLENEDGNGFEHKEDQLSLVRLHFQKKNYEDVLTLGAKFIETQERTPLRRDCLEMLALACKRLQRWEQMKEHLELQLHEFPSDLTARLELCKLHEHRTRNLPAAEQLCLEVVQRLETQGALYRADNFPRQHIEVFEKRLARIRRKLGKALGGNSSINGLDFDQI